MRPLLQNASRSLFAKVANAPSSRGPSIAARTFVTSASSKQSTCRQCQFLASAAFRAHCNRQSSSSLSRLSLRRFHQTPNDERKPVNEDHDNNKPLAEPEPVLVLEPSPIVEEAHPKPAVAETADATKFVASKPPNAPIVDNIERVQPEDLPSHKEAQRWDFSKRMNELMDELLPKLADVSHKVNAYTGTDYSGVEALRVEIKEQEKLVKARRAAIDDAKQAYEAAHALQASSQKEVVALLERKHSWSAADLERYMSLIRSEHINDQAVREAKEAIAASENALEEARAKLEKRERAQYHEEQIWSDTIRRNSTWVTFGLMGVNIFLLLASLLIFEPWRRRRMVREIKTALEAHKASIPPAAVIASTPSEAVSTGPPEPESSTSPASVAAVEAEIGKSVGSEEATQEGAVDPEPTLSASLTPAKVEAVLEEIPTTQDAAPDTTTEPATPGAAPLTTEGVEPQEAINIEEEIAADAVPLSWQDHITYVAKDIISERTISMRRLDFTTAILSSASAGAVIGAAIIAMLRQR